MLAGKLVRYWLNVLKSKTSQFRSYHLQLWVEFKSYIWIVQKHSRSKETLSCNTVGELLCTSQLGKWISSAASSSGASISVASRRARSTRNWGRAPKGTMGRRQKTSKTPSLLLSPSLPPLRAHYLRSKGEASGNEAGSSVNSDNFDATDLRF